MKTKKVWKIVTSERIGSQVYIIADTVQEAISKIIVSSSILSIELIAIAQE